jgi:hypothetical protein
VSGRGGLSAEHRDRLARPVVIAYWLLLVAGLSIYTFVVGGASTQALWIGALAGSVLGHGLALRDVRLWFVIVVLLGAGYLGLFVSPGGVAARTFWMALVPATLCAYASLADRWSLAACWFPAVTWMLTILDRTPAPSAHALDGLAIALLGVLAVAVVVFLRVRETRRVKLWQTAGASALAPVVKQVALTEAPGAAVFRTWWSLAVTVCAFGATMFIAPRLWQLEKFHRHEQQQAEQRRRAVAANDLEQLPCCQDCAVPSSRVGEYLDLGRGHDGAPVPGQDCRVCDGDGGDGGAIATAGGYTIGYGRGYGYDIDGTGGVPTTVVAHGDPVGTWYDGTGHVVAAPSGAPSGGPSGGEITGPITADTPPSTDAHEPASRPTAAAPAPAPVTVPPPAPAPNATASYVPPTPAPVMTPPVAPQSQTAPPPSPPEPARGTPPHLEPAAATAPTPSPGAGVAPPPSHDGDSSHVLEILLWLITGALTFQVLSLALRPLRRALVLRHLRAPFWSETVNQRVSNAWQLALIGLRDAGYRFDRSAGGDAPDGHESPREFAKRVGIAGLDRCATILERARYGVAIDAGDLADMQATADAVYRDAHGRVGGLARVAAQVRWPLA